MRTIDNIIIHCSDSSFGNVNHIRKWHLQRKWRDIGYHFVILNGRLYQDFFLPSLIGSVECGRPLNGDNVMDENEKGAHVLGYNATSIGICLIGRKDFPIEQLKSTVCFVSDLMNYFNIELENIIGHYETKYSRNKSCPNIDMDWFRKEIELQNG